MSAATDTCVRTLPRGGGQGHQRPWFKRQWDEWTTMPWEGKKPTRSWLATVLACEWDQWPRGHCYYPGWSTEKKVRSILRISLIGHMEKLLLKNRSYQENKAPCKTKGEYTTPSNSLNQSKHPGKLCLLCSSWFLPLVTWFSKFLVDFLLRIKLKGGSWEHRRTRISRGKGGEGDTAVLLLNDEIFFFFKKVKELEQAKLKRIRKV